MLKRLAWLCAAAMLYPAVGMAGGEDAPKAPAKKKAAPKAAVSHIPYSKPVDDIHVLNEHDHPLEGLYFPPETHHYQDLDTAPNDQLNRNVRILRTTNKAQLNRYVPIVYTFKNVNPFAVLRFIRRPIQLEEGAIFTFVNPDGKSGKVLIAVPEYQVDYMNNLMATIDRTDLTSSDGTTRIYRQLKHRRANIDPNDATLDDRAFIDTFGIYLTDNESLVIVDSEQNAVFIQDTPSGAEYLDKAITEKLDVPTPEALLNTKIYELDLKNNARIGLDFIAWKNGPGADLFAFGAFAEHGRVDLRHGSGSTMTGDNGLGALDLPRSSFEVTGYNFAYRYDLPSAFFDYLAVRGKAKVLNSAKIAALNTRTANITAGDEILYYPVQTSDPSGVRPRGNAFAANTGRTVIGTKNTTTTNEVTLATINTPQGDISVHSPLFTETSLTPLQTGLNLSLTPLIYENGLDVDIAGALTDYNGFDDTGTPQINSRSFSTKVRMGVGEEMILGGIRRDTHVKAANKVPFFGSIPVVGYLFGGENTRRTQSEVVIAIKTERIERFNGKGQGVTAEDETLMKQGDGTKAIDTPKTSVGFDQLWLDPEKAPYKLDSLSKN
ncbi:hypothetical protein HY256_00055 [Candidatus Sumerlaeota bacterium]|nr:hypothetical protein [Candidatus Sumerlaeota bacterium]